MHHIHPQPHPPKPCLSPKRPCTLGTMTTVLVVAAAIVIATPIVFACVIRDGARRNQAQEGGNNEGGQ